MHTSNDPALPTRRGYVPRHRAERPARGTRPVVRRLAVGAVTGLALSGTLTTLAPAAPAGAAESPGQDARDRDRQRGGADRSSNPFGLRGPHDELAGPNRKPDVPPATGVLRIAASKAGTPYAYGASGPNAFDCSGFTSWVYARVGKQLPRTSSAQAAATTRIPASAARPGDLVFFTGASGVYHVGIYAGGGTIWNSPRPGTSVRREAIWTSNVFYGRVR